MVKIALVALSWLLLGGIVALVIGAMAKARDRNG